MVRNGNNPKRRLARLQDIDPCVVARLAYARYTGSPHHKRSSAGYGFQPLASPRPNKSLCDGRRSVPLTEAATLFREGVRRGMVSTYLDGDLPKYVWAVDDDGRVFEAKISRGTQDYHGYELGCDEDRLRQHIEREWSVRCPTN